MTEESPKPQVPAYLETLAKKLDGKNPGLTTALKFDLGEGKVFRFVFDNGACRAELGDGPAAATVTVNAEDAERLLTGKLNPMVAFVTGKIKIAGDAKALLALQGILG